MTAIVTKTVSVVKANPLGIILGAAVAYYAAHKSGKVHHKWALAGIAVVGALVGAEIEAKIKAKHSMPTKETVTGK